MIMHEKTVQSIVRFTCLFLIVLSVPAARGNASWRDAPYSTELKNDAFRAKFQAGRIVGLEDAVIGKTLLQVAPGSLEAKIPLFGLRGIDLDACEVSVEKGERAVVTAIRAPDGTTCELKWSVEPGRGDLVLRVKAGTTRPVDRIQWEIAGCDITRHGLVVVDGNGNAQRADAPWVGGFSDISSSEFGYSPRFVHPLVALFQGEGSGWFVEGREPRIGPANALSQGQGDTARLVFVRGYSVQPTTKPELYEIRIRTYHGDWQDAVDPYIDWLEYDLGYVPIEKKPQQWVKEIRSQAYIDVGDYEGLEALAQRLDPAKTLLGRQGGYREHAWDHGFPDYTPSEESAKWFRRARELGFHVGAHVNTTGLDAKSELVEQFRHFLFEVVKDEDGGESFSGPAPVHSGRVKIRHPDGERIYWGTLTFAYSSAASKAWRNLIVERIRPLIECGVDMIYLDESMAPTGKFVVDGITAIEGVMTLERAILDAYPHVVLETEQINLMNARWSSFALTTLDLGHPLGGYLYQRFVKLVPEGYFYQPRLSEHFDPFDSFGLIYPGANFDPGWLNIAEAFQRYDLAPDTRLPRDEVKRSGFRGPDGVVAYFEKHATRRGLVVTVPGEESQWFGARVTNVRSWPGPGAIRNWFLYNGDTVLGLNPEQTYVFDKTVTLPADDFHVTDVPDNFSIHTKSIDLFGGQDLGPNLEYRKAVFTGTGEIRVFSPEGIRVFLDGEELSIDPKTRVGVAAVGADTNQPSRLIAYRVSDAPLEGKWVNLPWVVSTVQDPGKIVEEGDGFFNHVAADAQILGRFPEAKSIRMQGRWGMGDRAHGKGDGVISLNGKEVGRIPRGEKPYKMYAFDFDVSAYAGQYVLMDFEVDGHMGGFAPTYWTNPRIFVER